MHRCQSHRLGLLHSVGLGLGELAALPDREPVVPVPGGRRCPRRNVDSGPLAGAGFLRLAGAASAAPPESVANINPRRRFRRPAPRTKLWASLAAPIELLAALFSVVALVAWIRIVRRDFPDPGRRSGRAGVESRADAGRAGRRRRRGCPAEPRTRRRRLLRRDPPASGHPLNDMQAGHLPFPTGACTPRRPASPYSPPPSPYAASSPYAGRRRRPAAVPVRRPRPPAPRPAAPYGGPRPRCTGGPS